MCAEQELYSCVKAVSGIHPCQQSMHCYGIPNHAQLVSLELYPLMRLAKILECGAQDDLQEENSKAK